MMMNLILTPPSATQQLQLHLPPSRAHCASPPPTQPHPPYYGVGIAVLIARNSDCSGPNVLFVRWSSVDSFQCSSLNAGSRRYLFLITLCAAYCIVGGIFIKVATILLDSQQKKPGDRRMHASDRIRALPFGSLALFLLLGDPGELFLSFLAHDVGDEAEAEGSANNLDTSCCCAITPPSDRDCRHQATIPPVLNPTSTTFSLEELFRVDDSVRSVLHEVSDVSDLQQ